MTLGPIEVLVIAFPENRFTGEIMPELERLVDERHDHDRRRPASPPRTPTGNTAFVELAEIDAKTTPPRSPASSTSSKALVSDEDVEAITADLEPDSSAAILVFEHTWAKPLRDAVVGAGGILAANMRIPGAVVEEILAAVPDEPD